MSQGTTSRNSSSAPSASSAGPSQSRRAPTSALLTRFSRASRPSLHSSVKCSRPPRGRHGRCSPATTAPAHSSSAISATHPRSNSSRRRSTHTRRRWFNGSRSKKTSPCVPPTSRRHVPAIAIALVSRRRDLSTSPAPPPAPPSPPTCASCTLRGVCRGGCKIVAAHLEDAFRPDPECPRVRAR